MHICISNWSREKERERGTSPDWSNTKRCCNQAHCQRPIWFYRPESYHPERTIAIVLLDRLERPPQCTCCALHSGFWGPSPCPESRPPQTVHIDSCRWWCSGTDPHSDVRCGEKESNTLLWWVLGTGKLIILWGSWVTLPNKCSAFCIYSIYISHKILQETKLHSVFY